MLDLCVHFVSASLSKFVTMSEVELAGPSNRTSFITVCIISETVCARRGLANGRGMGMWPGTGGGRGRAGAVRAVHTSVSCLQGSTLAGRPAWAPDTRAPLMAGAGAWQLAALCIIKTLCLQGATLAGAVWPFGICLLLVARRASAARKQHTYQFLDCVCLQNGALAGAAWAPDSRTLLVAGAGARQLAALCLTRPAPALDAQLLPLPLPPPPAAAAEEEEGGFRIDGFAWDAAAERLAAALGAGRVAVYATCQRPVLSARLLSCLPSPGSAEDVGARKDRPPALPLPAAAEGQAASSGAEEGLDDEARPLGAEATRGAQQAGKGEQAPAPVLEFQSRGLLAVRWSTTRLTLHDCAAGF